MLSLKQFPAAVVTAGAFVLVVLSGFGATTNVTVGNPADKFTPAVVSINVGDQVVWTWAATFHSTTSGTNGVHGDDNGVPSGLWDSGVYIGALTPPHTFTNTFNSAGNFAYYCQIHFATPNFMTGAVLVASGTLPPVVFITNPVSGAVFAAPANVTLQAAASANGGSITNVQFRVGAGIVTNVTTAPYFATTNNLAAGSYTLSAIAADNNGITATNSISISVVTPVTAALTNSAVISGTNFQFSYLVNTGLSYVVQRAANLSQLNWISLVTNVAASNPVVFIDTHATNSPNFYRVGRMPNP